MKNEKFKIINETLSRNGNIMKVGVLCDIAGVSRSGFYNWLNSKQKRDEKESKDRKDFELILKAYNQKGYHKGAKAVTLCNGFNVLFLLPDLLFVFPSM